MNELYTELHRNILDVFNEYGVQIMTPAYEGDPAEPKVVPKKDWYLTRHSAHPARQCVLEVVGPVGYESEIAFSRAFKKLMEAPPVSWRRRARS